MKSHLNTSDFHKSLLEESLDTMVDVSEAVEDNLPVRVFLYKTLPVSSITCSVLFKSLCL